MRKLFLGMSLLFLGCSFNPDGLSESGSCGNGTIDQGEACDGTNFGGATCVSLGQPAGTLVCGQDCTFDVSGCGTAPVCGDGLIGGGETCDGTNLGGATCISRGFTGGTLLCRSDCVDYDDSQCEGEQLCGNGALDAGETCDGTALGGETCVTQGFVSGTLLCDASCNSFDLSNCSATQCGNGVVDAGEACDDGFIDDCGTCNADCTGPGTGATCGDGEVCPELESCDDGFTDACGTCNADCTGQGAGATCGDGEVCPELETCDDGYTDACGTCNATCTGPGTGAVCGDGFVCPELETCDDTYTDDCGSCNATCTGPGTGSVCGDGIVCPELEVCDDSYTDACGTCNADCTGAGTGSCGDGMWCPETEACDDGNGGNGDGCSAGCVIEDPYTCVNTAGSTSLCSVASSCPGMSVAPGVYSGNTGAALSEIPDYEGWLAPGKEQVYHIDVPDGYMVKGILNAPFDGVLAMTDSCPPVAGSLLAAADYYAGGTEEKTYWFNDTGATVTVYIAVDGYTVTDEGGYTLEIILAQPLQASTASALAFNEYFAYPVGTDDARHEWVEFYNGDASYINLNGCRFVTDSIDQTVNANLIVSPGEFFVFDNAGESTLNYYDNVIWGWTSGGGVIHGTNDTLYLMAPYGGVIDQIGPLAASSFPNNQGQAIALQTAYQGDKTANDTGTNWSATTTPTPGGAN